MNQIGLMKAFLNLTALQKRVPKTPEVKERYVQEYHSILRVLEQASGYNLDDFRVPEAEMHYKFLYFTVDDSIESFSKEYTTDLYCDRAVLMKKLGTILKYFTAPSSIREKIEVSFKLPDK
jgi:hypothetical protein